MHPIWRFFLGTGDRYSRQFCRICAECIRIEVSVKSAFVLVLFENLRLFVYKIDLTAYPL